MVHFSCEFEVLGVQQADNRHKENTRASLLVHLPLCFRLAVVGSQIHKTTHRKNEPGTNIGFDNKNQ